MSVQVIDNFSYKGKKGNFERDNFDTLQAMRSYPEDGIDDGHVCFCNEDGNHYKFNHLNSVDGATGRWRLHNKSVNTLTETGEGKVLDARQGKILKDLIDAKVIEAGGVSFDTVPTKGSTNPVTSNGIKEAMDEQAESINSNTGVDDYPVFSASEAYSKGKVVNYNGKLYKFTADHAAGAWTGTDVEPYNLKKDIEERYGTYTDNPEFIRAYTDAEGKFLWGIRIDGSIEWAKGVPTPIQNALKELADKIKDLGGDKIEEVETALNEKIEALQDAIDVINASLKTLTDTFSFQDSPEFVNVVTDAEGKVLFGIKEDGKPYFPKNTMYSVESNQEFLAAWLDSAGHVLFGLRTDGSTYVAKADFLTKIEEIRQLLEDNGIGDDALKQRVEALENNFTNLQDTFNNTFSIISNDEWLHAVVDADNKLLFGIKADSGEIVMPKQDTYKVVSNDEWLAAWLDSQDRILFGVKADGTFWAAKHNFNTGKDYDTQIEQINGTLSTMSGTLTSLQETVNGLEQGNEAMKMLSVIDDPEERLAVTTDKDEKVISYRDKDGVLHESKGIDTPKYYQNGEEKNFVKELADLEDVSNHNTPNLLVASEMQKTFNDGTNSFTPPNEGYEMSNPIECKAGDWFTRTGTATGMVVVTDGNDKNGTRLFNADGSTLGNTFQIPTDMTWVRYIRMAALRSGAEDGTIAICKGKEAFVGNDFGDFLTISTLKILSTNIDKDATFYVKSNSGKYYQITVNDSNETPIIELRDMTGIPMSELPSDFPTFKVSGDFSKYYDGLVFSPVEGGVTNYLYELASNGLVKRYIKQKVNCPRILKEGDTWYFYGVNGSLNSSNGKLNIYKANGETFELVKGNLGGGSDGSLQIEPHDCLVISVNPLHYIYQRYVGNQYTTVDGQQKRVTALHVGEIYEGNLLYEWHSEDYPELWVDSHVQDDNADYLHNNTISISADGNLYLNNKQANQILVIERTWDEEQHTATIGEILWKIGGNRTHAGWDVPTRIKTTTEQQWYESHDSVISDDGLITMFDNKWSGASRILEFKIDTGNKQLTDFKAHTWQQYRGRFMGSVDKLGEGIYLVSWGSQRNGNAANAGIYDFNKNEILFEIRFDNTGSSAYRVYGIPKGQE